MASSQNAPLIRYATEDDVPTILALIRELAEYEKALDSVEATEETLLATLSFPSNPSKGFAKTLLIFPPPSEEQSPTPSSSAPPPPAPRFGPTSHIRQAKPLVPVPPTTSTSASNTPECAGMALFFTNYSTWRAAPGVYLEDLFVRPQYRKRGYATALLRRLAAETLAIGGRRLEWSVLKWNTPSIDFYVGDTVGAERMEEWVGMRVHGSKLERLANGGGGGGTGSA